jgi:hypothetical protein
MTIALIIFTRNERRNSEIIFSKIPFSAVKKTYVIDGNSTDGTKEFWESKGIRVYDQKYKGVGGAYESAFRSTTEDALIFFHPDGNMLPKDISKFAERLKRDEEFIIASRMLNKSRHEADGQFFKYRKWSAQILAVVINSIWGKKKNIATDLTQGFRAITRNAYKKMNISIPSAVAPDTEQIIKALKQNIRITEFPTKESERMYGKTSMPSFTTSIENIKVFLRELF